MRDDALDQPGATGRAYRIERLIGTGGAAAVYEARRLGPNCPGEPVVRVACKVMHAERWAAPGFRKLVWDEAVLGLRMTAGHPNLVEVFDFFDDAQEQLCIVMELVDGVNVDELRGPELPLPFPIVRRIAMEVLEALVHLHGRNVLYRDLSLRNILVTTGGVVKLTDFGIARVMEQGLVHTINIRGTAVYLSPEALERFPLDARADLFSLGAILYDLVAGQPPCGNQDMLGTIFARNLLGRFDPLPPDTPEDLAELITGLLQPDRGTRWPQTAAEVLALLRGGDQPVASHEQLAALVVPARSLHDQEFEDNRPTNVLPAGHVLALREDGDAGKRTAGEPSSRWAGVEARALPERVAESAVEVLPARVAEGEAGALPEHVAESAVEVLPAREADLQANPLPDLVAYFGAEQMARLIDALPAVLSSDLMIELVPDGAPDHAAEHVGDAVPEHIDDLLPHGQADRAPSPVVAPAADAQPGRMAEDASGGTIPRRSRLARRFVARRAAAMAVAGCVLVLGLLLDDGFRRERVAVELQQRPEGAVRLAEPTTAPGTPARVTPAEPHRVTERADDLRRQRVESRIRRAGRARLRREYVPPGDGPPPWVQR